MSSSALILVAGRHRTNDPLQRNIHNVTNAVQRGFAFAATLSAIKWHHGIISADVKDDQGVLTVWAKIYKPSYAPPDDSAEEMPQETLPTVLLQDQNQDGTYEGLYDNFSEQGQYRIVIYATDTESLQGEPVTLNVQVGSPKLYLPLVMR